MRLRLVMLVPFAVGLALAGCRSTAPKSPVVKAPGSAVPATNSPVAKPAPSSQPTSTLAQAKVQETAAKDRGDKIKAVEKSLDARRAEQERIARQLEDVKKQILETAQSLRDLKARTDALTGVQATNAAGIAQLEQQLAALKQAPSKQVEDLKAQLDKEQKERAKAAADAAEKGRELEALKKQKAAAPAVAAKPAPSPAPAPAATPAVAPAAQATPSASAYKLVADGNQLLRTGKLAEAEQAFSQALAQAPGLVGAKVGLAACRYNAGDLDGAMKLAGEVLAVEKKNAQALGIKGLVLRSQGKLREANAALSDAVRYDPTDSQLRNYLGAVLQDRGETGDALREMRKAVELDGGNIEARYNLAVLLATDRKPALYEARVHYEYALKAGLPRDEAMDKLLYGGAPPAP